MSDGALKWDVCVRFGQICFCLGYVVFPRSLLLDQVMQRREGRWLEGWSGVVALRLCQVSQLSVHLHLIGDTQIEMSI